MRRRGYKITAWILAAAVVFGPASFMGHKKDARAAEKEQSRAAVELTDQNVKELYQETTVGRDSVHDPSVVKDGDTWYVFGSHMGVSKTTDLQNWTSVTSEATNSRLFGTAAGTAISYTEAFKENAFTGTVDVKNVFGQTVKADFGSYDAAAWIGDNTVQGNMWAPDVIYNKAMGKWCMYLSLNGAKWNSSIILLTADDIEGPYVYQGPVLFSGFSVKGSPKSYENTDLELVTGALSQLPEKYQKISSNTWGDYWPHAIDPCVFYDEDGKLWMAYGSWSGGIYMLELDEKTGLRDYTVSYEDTSSLGKNVTSDPYFGKKIAGGYYVSGEGSYIKYIGGYYYLFLSYGFYSPEGGYNMRLFRSRTPDGPYVDTAGVSAINTSYTMNYNGSDNRGMKLMGNYKWSSMDTAEVAQGHNSAYVDQDGKAYVIFHTKFADGTEGHQLRVHQLFLNEDGWTVAAPYEYAGETLYASGYEESRLTGEYELIIHRYQVDYANLEYVEPVTVKLNADHTVSGAASGTWEEKSGSAYATLVLDGVTYKGVFTEQTVTGCTENTMCFTAVSADGVNIWGSKKLPDQVLLAKDVQKEAYALPENTWTDLNLAKKTENGSSITWESGNPSVISADGTVSRPSVDTAVTMTATIAKGNYYYKASYVVNVLAKEQNAQESYVLAKYFTDTPTDLRSYSDGSLKEASPFYKLSYNGLNLSGGAVIEFDVTNYGGSADALATLLAFGGKSGKLYFTQGSYLGYNADGGYYDANMKNYALVQDYIGKKDPAHVEIELTESGFEVSVDGTVAYNQEILGTENGSGTVEDYKSVLSWLKNTADTLYFGSGSWWTAAASSKISNVVVKANPITRELEDDSQNQTADYFTAEQTVLGTADAITYYDNPLYGKDLDSIYVEYTINWDENAAKNGWDGLFSFLQSASGGRVSFQSAPYLCFNDQNGNWLDFNKPDLAGADNVAAGTSLEKGKDYTFTYQITSTGIRAFVDGQEIEATEASSGVGYEDLIRYIASCNKITLGVGEAAASYWNTELCTIKDLYVGIEPIEKEQVALTGADFILYEENPFYAKNLDGISVAYTINWNADAAKNGWDGLFSFFHQESGMRVSFQSAPYVCFNGGGKWMDLNSPSLTGAANAAAGMNLETGKDYRFEIKITKESAEMYIDGTKLSIAQDGSSASYEDILSAITSCDKLTWGVGKAVSAYWWTELCTLKDVKIRPL